ncbi:MAG: hypothetical protein LBS70_03335 [Candidatus Accumulibacter sp.]|jgi:hypothetical protein|nr:hypothetical protein [Accumulibacter sp.]
MRRLISIMGLSLACLMGGCSAGMSCSWIQIGCHGFWKEHKDELIGTKLDLSKELRYSRGVGIPQGEKFYYRIEQEPPNTRYYIRWSYHCRYSLLVAPDNTILSWRFDDTEDPEWSCFIR